MGYYNQRSENPGTSKGQSSRGWFWSGLIGAIIGVLITAFVLPQFGLTVKSTNTGAAVANAKTNSTPSKVENLNLNVNDAFTKAVQKVSGAIVEIVNYQKPQTSSSSIFGTGPSGPSSQKAQPYGLGSGIIYKKENDKAYIVTNDHVVKGASRLEVRINKNTKVPGTLVGSDPLNDLAVVKINASKVKEVATFGNSDNLKRGEPVVAIGNPLGLSGSVTEGVVSSKKRLVQRSSSDGMPSWDATVIQTDAAINPGNSGGALINLKGQVVGINSMKIAKSNVSGIGFAIPINIAKPIIQQIMKTGKVTRPFLGISYETLSQLKSEYGALPFKLPGSVKNGLYVAKLVQGGPADKAGIHKGDIITSINNHKIQTSLKFREYLYKQLKPGQRVKVTFYRNGHQYTGSLTLGKHSFK